MKKLLCICLVTLFGFTLCNAEDAEKYSKYKTPLFKAIAEDDIKALAAALNDGADVNAKENGDTALIVAFNEGSLRFTNILLSYGADPNIAGAEGKTAFELGDKAKTYENFQKFQSMQQIVKNNYKRKKYLKMLVKDEDNAIILSCDELLETKYIYACKEDKNHSIWKIYNNRGTYLDLVFGLKALSAGNKQYFIAKGKDYSVFDDRWQKLKSGLKQVTPKIEEDGDAIVFEITDNTGNKSVYRP